MAYQFLKRTQTPTYILILVVMSHGLIELHGLSASLICSPNKLCDINFIKKLASWNGFPRSVVKSIIHQVLNTTNKSTDNIEPPLLTIDHLCSYALL